MRPSTSLHYQTVELLPDYPAPGSPPPGKVQIIVLGSGSQGNSLLVVHGAHCLMVDAGFSPAQTRERARSVGYALARLDALLLTHGHQDHAQYAVKMCGEFGCPMVSSRATLLGLPTQPAKHRKAVAGELLEDLGGFLVYPIAVPHDAEGTMAYHIRVGDKNIVVAHDLGSTNSSLWAAARAADALLIEANHDSELLQQADGDHYSEELKARIASDQHGHLANTQMAEVVSHIDPDRLQIVCLTHLSQHTNTPVLAERAARQALPLGSRAHLYVASQDTALLLEVNGGPAPQELTLTESARKLDRKVDALIGEQRRSNEEGQRRWIQLGLHLLDMQRLFESHPGEVVLGFTFFTDWLASKAQEIGKSKRRLHYCLDAAKTVVPLIGIEAAQSLTVHSTDALAKYVKDKNELPADLVEFAESHYDEEVRREVFKRLYPGKTGHFDGPEAAMTLTAGRECIEHIQELIQELRGYVGTQHAGEKGFEAVGDAEVVEMALITLQHERDAEAATTMPILTGEGEVYAQSTKQAAPAEISCDPIIPEAPDIEQFLSAE